MDNDRYFLQLKVYFKKYMRVFFNSNGILKILSTFIITAMVLTATSKDAFDLFDETRTTLFAIVCACIWTGLFNSIEIICSERNSIRQEHKSGNVSYSVFLFSHMLVELILCLVEALIISAMVLSVYKKGLEVGKTLDLARVIYFTLSVFFIIYASDMLGLMISSLVKSNKMAMTVMPFALICQLVLSNFIFKLDGWKEILSKFTIANWGLKSLGIAIDIFNSTNAPEASKEYQNPIVIDKINRLLAESKIASENFYKTTLYNVLITLVVLILFIVVHAAIARFALGRIDKDER